MCINLRFLCYYYQLLLLTILQKRWTHMYMISNSSFQLNICTNLLAQAIAWLVWLKPYKQRWCHVMMRVFIRCIVWNLYIMCTFLVKRAYKVEILCRKCHDDSAIHYTLLCTLVKEKPRRKNNIWVKTIISFLWLCIKHCRMICSEKWRIVKFMDAACFSLIHSLSFLLQKRSLVFISLFKMK